MTKFVYLDANILIKAFEANDAEAEIAWKILRSVASGDLRAMTSELTLAEVLPKPVESGDNRLVQAYEEALNTGAGLTVAPVTRSILRRAAVIRSTARAIRLPDAIHVATALEHGCIIMLSDDRRIKSFDGLRIVSLASTSFDALRILTS